jgi:hypothetical protein
MAVPYDPTDPNRLTSDQRLDELTAILAAGMRRLLGQRASHPVSLLPESDRNGLDVSADLSVHVSRPVNTDGERS